MYRIPKVFMAASLIFALAGVSAAQTPAPEARNASKCFRTDDIRGFDNSDRQKLVVETYSGDFYELQLAPGCMDIDHAFKLGFRGRHGTDRVCGSFDAEVIYRELSGGLSRCAITQVRPFTPEETAQRKAAFGRKKDKEG